MVDDLLEATRRVNDGDRISVSYLSVMDVRLYIPHLRPHRLTLTSEVAACFCLSVVRLRFSLQGLATTSTPLVRSCTSSIHALSSLLGSALSEHPLSLPGRQCPYYRRRAQSHAEA